MTTLFVSDLHLDETRPGITACFLRFLRQTAGKADALYILGDLFEVWLGDDDPAAGHREIANALREFTADGTPCYLTRGNRDFLIGKRFAAESGLQLLDEKTIVDIDGERVLLMHGDELCTDDPAYQRLRRIVRNGFVQWIYLLLPLGLRRAIANQLRRSSQETLKPDDITDVNANTVATTMGHARVRVLIHGHTHRPAIHQLNVDGEPALRIVLGDWYSQGSVLRWTAAGPELGTLALQPSEA
ncbi:MAG: UDP-2,3-diacylglucosamine diphosphatase [Gammaproteobacteria bacterium]